MQRQKDLIYFAKLPTPPAEANLFLTADSEETHISDQQPRIADTATKADMGQVPKCSNAAVANIGTNPPMIVAI